MGLEESMQRRDLEYTACELCGAAAYEPFMKIDDWSIVRCMRCGLVYVNPRPCLESILKMYREGSEAEASWTVEYADFYGQDFREMYSFLLSTWIRYTVTKQPSVS